MFKGEVALFLEIRSVDNYEGEKDSLICVSLLQMFSYSWLQNL